ncbi:MAG: hypothetical protein AAGC55_19470 [Myxococcota bacterium]
MTTATAPAFVAPAAGRAAGLAAGADPAVFAEGSSFVTAGAWPSDGDGWARAVGARSGLVPLLVTAAAPP